EDRLISLIRSADEEREAAERIRLAYVAATRAKERLHLVCRIGTQADAPPARSLLAPLWPALADTFSAEPSAGEGASTDPSIVEPVLERFADGYAMPADELRDPRLARPMAPALPVAPGGAAEIRPEFEWARWPAIQVGTLVHRRLKRIADEGLDTLDGAALDAERDELWRELELLGLERDAARRGVATIVTALRRVVEDEVGRWILRARAEAASEVELVVENGGYLERLKLDRTFVEDGVRWIIDFKTGTHEGADLEAFLDAEVERYRAQLERYARAMRGIDARPIKVGLYFPLLRAFKAWTP